MRMSSAMLPLREMRFALSNIFADDITWIEDTGYRNKREVLHRYLAEIQEHSWELLDVRIRIEGHVEIVSSHIHVIKTVDGNSSWNNWDDVVLG